MQSDVFKVAYYHYFYAYPYGGCQGEKIKKNQPLFLFNIVLEVLASAAKNF